MKKVLLSIFLIIGILTYALIIHSQTIRDIGGRLETIERDNQVIHYSLNNTKLILDGFVIQQKEQQKLLGVTLSNLDIINNKLDILLKEKIEKNDIINNIDNDMTKTVQANKE